MKNSKLRAVLTTMLAVRELRLDGHGYRAISDSARSYVLAETAAIREALSRLELLDEARIINVKERVLLDWEESDADREAVAS